jgi:hypothetical protein
MGAGTSGLRYRRDLHPPVFLSEEVTENLHHALSKLVRGTNGAGLSTGEEPDTFTTATPI